ncbi:dihydrofolate reductase [Geomesophilobacter sediminis]|uniref:dihydrofolate reductase n=1 Tax=Geomesophilobacter sediminis TaxID=2798584 RepID=A0A8J7M4G3_9BACT|nr:dihydrofolate reductase [Geomesophilobacter sediminis]MBJ6727818.1 dihydrofolate reductase [Geomesophilobacter sediminis]
MIISMIAAMSENRVIGSGGKLPWNIPADMARFKALTMGHVVVMGRKTFESIGHPLPGRTNIVLSRSKTAIEGCVVAGSLEEAINAADGEEELFILGGANVFREALPLAHRIYLTIVHQNLDGDVFFPELPDTFLEIRREALPGTTPACSFTIQEKVEPLPLSGDADALVRKGQAALKRELHYLARSCFQQASALRETPETSSFLAFCMVKSSGDIPAALDLARGAVEQEPHNPLLYLNLGRVQILAGQKEAALDTFRRGIKAGGGAELIAELERYGTRRPPPIKSLSRGHFLNKYLGILLYRLGLR